MRRDAVRRAPRCVAQQWGAWGVVGVFVLTLSVVAVGAGIDGSGVSGRFTAVSAGHYYMYFDQPVPMLLATDRFAVYAEDDAALALLAAYGVDAAEAEALVVPGWHYAPVPAAQQSAAGVASLLAAIAEGEETPLVSPVLVDEEGDPALVLREVLVQFAPQVTKDEAAHLLRAAGVEEVLDSDWAGLPNAYRARLETRDGFAALDAANALAARGDVVFAEPDMLRTTRRGLIPNDIYFSQLWGIRNIGQSGGTAGMDMSGHLAWDVTLGDPSVTIVILDDGVQSSHPDLALTAQADFTSAGTGGEPGNACDNHGTAVAAGAGATINNFIGISGIAPNCGLAAAKFTISNVPCNGGGFHQTTWLVNALTWADSIGARVTNNSNSFGSTASVSTKYAATRITGMVHFSSTGNSGSSTIGFPANLSTVMAVGSVNRNGNRSGFSQYGAGIAMVAPGEVIRVTDRTGSAGYVSGDYADVSGTSFSSPYAAGVAALVLSVDPTLTSAQVEQILNSTCTDRGTPGYDTEYGHGIVNAHQAVLAALPDEAPGDFNLIAPGAGAVDVALDGVAFEWSAASGAETYDFWIAATPDFAAPVVVREALATTQTVVSELEQNTQYYWRVVAVNSAGDNASTPEFAGFVTVVDCNDNRISDALDIASGFSTDCNGSGIPDECEIATGVLADCDENGVPDACQLDASGLAASYFENAALEGAPRGRVDPQVNFNWGTEPPVPGWSGEFSVRWTGYVETLEAGEYTFHALADDGVRVWVGGAPLIDAWFDQSLTQHDGVVTLDAETVYAIRVEYYQGTGPAILQLLWTPPGGAMELVPAAQLRAGRDCNANGLLDACDLLGGTSLDADGDGIPDECQAAVPHYCPGDMNCDGIVSFADISLFIAALKTPNPQDWQYDPENGVCAYLNGDFTGNGLVDFGDISGFIAAIKAGSQEPCTTVP